ncbi:MAG: DUF1127 domain-containing protein [Devosia sp.]
MNILASFIRRSAHRKAYAELLHMDDHMLRDIGVTRSEVRELMAGARTAHKRADNGND